MKSQSAIPLLLAEGDYERHALVDRIADENGKEHDGAAVNLAVTMGQQNITISVLNDEGLEMASVVLEAYNGEIRAMLYPADAEYGDLEPEIVVMAPIE